MRAAATLALLASTAPPVLARDPPAASDHAAFDTLLRANVENGMVDYDAFARSSEFSSYLEWLADARFDGLNEPERLALWVNAYNAYTIELINAHQERGSIRNINKTLGFLKLKGPWRERLARVGGAAYTLDEIEHEIIRKRFEEPRIHFALVCAAMGCPPLRSEAYVGGRLDAQLEEQARRFILESPRKNRVDVERKTVHVSMIFRYYRADFGGRDAAIGLYLAGFYAEGPERELLLSGRLRLHQTPYDWTLNSREQALGLASRR